MSPIAVPDRPGGVGLGVDIGGTGIKSAPVELANGALVGPRLRFDTPRPATPATVVPVLAELVGSFDHHGPVGVTFPGVVRHGVVRSAANLDRSWIGIDAAAVFAEAIGRPVGVLNDADAAGWAEVRLGAGRGRRGVVVMLTFGTGIGSGVFIDGRMVPNTEFGHLEVDGVDAEQRASARARERDRLTWEEWAARVERYLDVVTRLLTPDLIIIGGGASKKASRWFHMIRPPSTDITEIVTATFVNNAGIIGAALFADSFAAGSSDG